MVAPVQALALIPDELPPWRPAPLLCAGITTYNALRHSGARAGDLVAILGIGGLGHLGVQFAARMGFRTVAIARGGDKADLARQLGAHDYIDSRARERRRAADGAGRGQRDPGNGHQRQGDERRRRRARRRRQAARGRRQPRADRGLAVPADRPAALDPGLALRRRRRLGGHPGLQRAQRRAADGRDLSRSSVRPRPTSA